MKQKKIMAAAVKATAAAWLAMSLIVSGCSKNEGDPTGEAGGGAAKGKRQTVPTFKRIESHEKMR
ncbi:hypothetical protein [Paenibacillus sp. GCM10012303]|uniref:hypothetical protein n=1 Tax=Paenibacillus sp. GCM10012303 TaxID=3317340 RepID=UPI0036136D05